MNLTHMNLDNLFGGPERTHKRKYVSRGTCTDLNSLIECLKRMSNVNGRIYYEVWQDGGPPRRKKRS